MAHYENSEFRLLVDSVNNAPKAPLLVGIDGQGGSGKSTLANDLAEAIERSSAIVEGDDFYSDIPDTRRRALTPAEGSELFFDWRRLKREVLLPTKSATDRLQYQRYDWENARMGDWVDIPMEPVVIVEGVYMLRPALRDLWDIKVFVEAGSEVRLKRQLDRGENSSEWISRWIAAEDFYVTEHEPRLVADWVVCGG